MVFLIESLGHKKAEHFSSAFGFGAQERKGRLVFGIGCKPFVYWDFLFCLFRLCAVLCAVSNTTLEGSFSPSVSLRNCWLRG